MGLREYRKKRDFQITREPRGGRIKSAKRLAFVIQKHAASHLHYDFRLELEGVLKSWAVPKGPSLDPAIKRLAMQVEDHPVEYGDFEGIIPKGEYGGGTVMLWDKGSWEPEENAREAYRRGSLKFLLKGEKLGGKWMLVRRGGKNSEKGERNWFLFKERDQYARAGFDVALEQPLSVTTGRSLEEIAKAEDRIWSSKGKTDKSKKKSAKGDLAASLKKSFSKKNLKQKAKPKSVRRSSRKRSSRT